MLLYPQLTCINNHPNPVLDKEERPKVLRFERHWCGEVPATLCKYR
jgi:hypothetical protein